ncbi:MAG TPA: zinc-binding dehydrogenase, partial [Candidatus Tumulicola sp.]|nr:zinc-binding dehydrogenase [Candidatus Tumulicola sp.]
VATAGAGDAAYVRDLGAAETIDFRTERFEDRVRDVDAVIDTIGGDTQDRSFAVLARGGVLVSSVSAPSPEKAAERGVRVAYFIVDVTASALATIARLIDDGKLAPDLGVVLPLEAAREAHEMLAGSLPHPRGKIVLGVAALAPP